MVVLDSCEFKPVQVSQLDLQQILAEVLASASPACVVVDPLKLPVPEIICQDPADDDDSLRCLMRPGTGTATGEVRFGGNKGDREPCVGPSFWAV